MIFSRPELRSADRKWVEDIRREHDPQHAFADAHFTLVFPFDGVPCDEVVSHAGAVADSTPAVAFRLTAATAVRDAFSPRSHVFLVPSDGEAEMKSLHRRLYSGVLARKLRGAAMGSRFQAAAGRRITSAIFAAISSTV